MERKLRGSDAGIKVKQLYKQEKARNWKLAIRS
jgi:hypothetical protein